MDAKKYNSSIGLTGRRLKVAITRRVCFWIASSVLLFAFTSSAKDSHRFIPGQILVKPKAGVSEDTFNGKLKERGALEHRKTRGLNAHIIRVSEENAEAVLAALRKDPEIEFAERDYVAEAAFVPNDPYVSSAWHLNKIQAMQAWDGTTGNSNGVVAVLDSGVNPSHPDLAGRLLPGYDFVLNRTNMTDDFGHGTAVIGAVAAAGNNGIGVVGVAFGCRVMPVKVMDQYGYASYSAVAEGMHYAVDHGARIINISIVGSAPSSTLQEAVDYAWTNNVVVIAAAGNNANNTPQYPAACTHAVAVSATASDDSLATFSSYGAYVTLSAPGDGIWTTQRYTNELYGSWRGTSFASPVVAGVAALMVSANPTLTADQIVSVLKETAQDLGAEGYDQSFGYGRVNALGAVVAASSLPGAVTTPPLPAPSVTITSPSASSQFAIGTPISLNASAAAGSEDASVTDVSFLANGALIATIPAPAFSYTWTPGIAGSYSLTAVARDSQGLSATSAPVVIKVLSPETVPPTVAFTSAPQNGARLSSPTVLLAGTAKDNSGLNYIEVRVNNGPAQPASGTTNWSAPINLTPGTNVVRVRAIDLAGNVSSYVSRTFSYVVLSPLTTQVNGLGSITQAFSGNLLEIGRNYTIKAVPGTGQLFAGWSEVASLSPMLTFKMQSNMVLTANFVPNPFLPIKGSYAGLVVNSNGVTPETSGYFSMTLNGSGTFSGKLLISSNRFTFGGKFTIAGDSLVKIPRGTSLSPLILTLHVDLTDGTDRVSGSLTDGGWVSEASGDRNVFNSTYNPAAQAGVRDFILQHAENTELQAGKGAGKISTGGAASVQGYLEDGRSFSTTTMLAKNGDCPFYLSLSKGKEVVIGWLNFPTTPDPTASGTVLWVRSGTNAFAATLRAASAP